MNINAMFKISYGLYVLTTKVDGKDNGCIINTASQVALVNNQIGISVDKANLPHDMIQKSKKFNVSVLSEKATFDIFKQFGFQSGRDADKFAGGAKCKRAENGIYYVTEGTNAYYCVDVTHEIDLGSHTLFIGIPNEMEILDETTPSTTYDYYQKHIKPKPEAVGKTKDGQTIWRCRICNYEYVGEELPEDYICPICKHPASDFDKVEG